MRAPVCESEQEDGEGPVDTAGPRSIVARHVGRGGARAGPRRMCSHPPSLMTYVHAAIFMGTTYPTALCCYIRSLRLSHSLSNSLPIRNAFFSPAKGVRHLSLKVSADS